MINIGQYNFLKIARKTGRGTFLAAGNLGELFLPKSQTPEYCEAGDKIEVFIYRNSDDETVATTKRPRASVGDIACLDVVSANSVGAFLDWGLPKDLFAPFGQQSKTMSAGERHIVAVYQDNTGRIAASSKLNRFVKGEAKGLKVGQKVKALVGDKTDIGYKLIVNSKFWGVLHNSEVEGLKNSNDARIRNIKYGKAITAYVKNVRVDGKLDMTLFEMVEQTQDGTLNGRILNLLKDNNGYYAISDKSPPEEIFKTFSVSKKVFKATLGKLYKNRQIIFVKENGKNGIRLNKK